MTDKVVKMDVKEFRELGILQEANRLLQERKNMNKEEEKLLKKLKNQFRELSDHNANFDKFMDTAREIEAHPSLAGG